jgi:DNA-binding transcriptional LysR family regulator
MDAWPHSDSGDDVPQVDAERLRYLQCIAGHGSITRAAIELGMSQPALSRQVRRLEDDLGVALLVRGRRGVHLTPSGEHLLAGASAPLRHLDLAMRWIGSTWGRMERPVRLGIPATIAPALAVPILATVSTALPWLHMTARVAESGELLDRLRDEDLDFAVLDGCPPEGGPPHRTLAIQPWVLIGSARSGLQPGCPVQLSAATQRPLALLTGPGGGQVSHALRQHNTTATRIETDSVDVAKALAAGGVADSVLPVSACLAEIHGGHVRYAPLGDGGATQSVVLAHSPALQAQPEFAANFADLIGGEVTRLVSSGHWPAQLAPPAPADG